MSESMATAHIECLPFKKAAVAQGTPSVTKIAVFAPCACAEASVAWRPACQFVEPDSSWS